MISAVCLWHVMMGNVRVFSIVLSCASFDGKIIMISVVCLRQILVGKLPDVVYDFSRCRVSIGKIQNVFYGLRLMVCFVWFALSSDSGEITERLMWLGGRRQRCRGWSMETYGDTRKLATEGSISSASSRNPPYHLRLGPH